MYVKMPYAGNLSMMYPAEMAIGQEARTWLNKKLGANLPKDEAVSIAMHIINAEALSEKAMRRELDKEALTEETVKLVEEYFGISINREGFNYSRFVMHMEYLYQRKDNALNNASSNRELFETMKTDYPSTYECVVKVKDLIESAVDWTLNDEELLYLMLHVNRLASREEQ